MAYTAASIRSLVTRGRYGELMDAMRSGLAVDLLREIDTAQWWRPWRVSAWQFAQLRRSERGLPRIDIPALPPAPPAGGRPPPVPPAPPSGTPRPFVSFRRMAPGETFTGSSFGLTTTNRNGFAGTLTRAPLRELGATGAQRVQDLFGQRFLAESDLAAGIAQRAMAARRGEDLLERARASVRGTTPTTSTATLTLAARFADSFAFTVHVPGTHYSGHPNDEVLDWLAHTGRDFRADTPALRAYVRERLVDVFSRGEWNAAQAARVTARAVREWIVRRFEVQGGDIDLSPLSPRYRAWKSAHGFSGRIGIKTGFLLSHVRNAEVTVTQ